MLRILKKAFVIKGNNLCYFQFIISYVKFICKFSFTNPYLYFFAKKVRRQQK